MFMIHIEDASKLADVEYYSNIEYSSINVAT